MHWYVKNKNRKVHTLVLILATVVGGALVTWGGIIRPSFAQSISQIPVAISLFGEDNKTVSNGEYQVRFALYRTDRTTRDTYPSNTDAGNRLWEETQTVTVEGGIIRAYLGTVNPIQNAVNFESGDYYLGIRIGTDSEMVPRKKLGAVPAAINSQYLRGKTVGTSAGDLVALDARGKISIKQLPVGTGANQVVRGNDSRLKDAHQQNTDTGTDSEVFNIGSGTAIGGTNFDLSVSSAGTPPSLRYNGSTQTWQFSNDGSTFSNISNGTIGTVTLGTDTDGNYVASVGNGNGITGGAAGSEGAALTLGIDLLDSSDGAGSTSSNSGLEFGGGSGNELALLQGCANGQALAWNDTTGVWECTSFSAGLGGSGTTGYATYWSGTSSLGSEQYLDEVRGGTGLDASAASNGSLLIGNGSGFTLNTLGTGNGISVTNGVGLITVGLDVATTGTTATTSSNSGLETDASGLKLLGGCSNDQVLAWSSGSSAWVCSNKSGGTSDWTSTGSLTYLTDTTDDLVIGGSAVDEGFFFDVSAGTLSFEGTTANGFETTLAVTDPTADRTITLPNVTGTVITSGNLTDITAVGTVASGTWNGTVIGTLYGGTGATSLTNLIALTTHTTGNYVASLANGNGITGGAAGSEGATLTLGIDLLDSTDSTGSTSSISGLEFQGTGGNELTLLQGCGDLEVLAWNETTDVWECRSITGVGGINGSGSSNAVAYWSDADTLTYEAQLSVSRGGTGIGSYTIGDILYADGASSLAKLADVATGNVLLSGGVGVAPSWGKVNLATAVTGTLGTANGGTGATSLTDLIALTTHTTGNYVQSITNGSGISGGNGGSEGAALTLALGALTADWNQTGAFDISLNNAGSELQILESAGATFFGILDAGDLSANRTLTIPDVSGVIATTNGGQTFTSATWNGSTIGVAYGGTGVGTFGGTNRILYTTTTDNLSSIATANSGVLVTNGSGVPSIATDIPTGVTIGGAYVYRVGGADIALADGGTGASLVDPNADRIFFWDDSAGATDWLTAASNFTITGTTIDLSSSVQLGSNGADGVFTIFSEQGATDYTTVFQPGTQTQNVTYTLPPDDGGNGHVLTTNGTGTLTWSSVAGAGGVTGTGTTNYAVYWDSTSSIAAEQYLSISRGGTGTALTDPNADRVVFWDDSAGNLTYLDITGNLSISGTTLDVDATLQLGSNGTDGTLTIFSEQGATDYTTVFQPGTQTQDITYTLPNDDGASGQVLVTNGTGTLSWSSVSGAGGVTGTGTTNYAVYWDSTSSIAAEQYLSISRGGTGTALTDPNADRIVFWDDSAGNLTYLTAASNFSITGTTIDLASSIQLGSNGTDGTLTIFSEQGATDYTTVFQPGTQTQNVTYTLPNDDGASNQVLVTDGSGNLSWQSVGGVGAGDITDIGDVASGAAFTSSGTQGTSLWFYDADGRGQLTIANLTAARTYTLPDVTGTIATLNGGQTFTSATWNGSTIGVAYGGTGATTLTSNGVLYGNGTGAVQATSAGANATVLLSVSGTPTFVALANDVTIDNAGNVTIGADKVALTTDTTGNYVATITAGDGISGTVASEGSTPTLAIDLLDSADGTSLVTSSNSGLEFQGTGSDELTLLQGCSDNNVLSWDEAASTWNCDSVSGVGGIDGTGSANAVAYWTDSNTLSNEAQLAVSRGGTGIGSYTTGDILYASNANTLAARAAVATGNVLISQGVGVAPVWGDVDLTNSVTGILPIANGGTGASTLSDLIALGGNTTGNYVASITNGSGITGGNGGSEGAALTLALGALTADWNQTGAFDISLNNAGAELQILESAGATFFGILDAGDLSANRTLTIPDVSGVIATTNGGQTFTSATWNASTIGVAYGGTGVTTITPNGVLYGNGTGAVQATSAGANATILISVSGTPTFVAVGNDVTIDNAGNVTIGANAVTLGTDTTGNYVSSATTNGGLTLTGTEGASLGILLPAATDALSTTTQSGSGLELTSSGLSLIQGCAPNDVLSWDETNDVWKCNSVGGVGAGDITAVGNVTSGAAFDGTAGTELYFNDADGDGTLTIANLTAARTYTLPDLTGTVALSANNLSFFSATTSAQLAGVISDETGSGALVFGTSPTVSTLTVSSGGIAVTGNSTITGTLGSLTGLTSSGTVTFSGLTADRLVSTTTGGALTTSISSANAALSITDETGSGLLVFGTSPTLTTPRFADLGYLADSNGNELLILDLNASAVNEFTIANAATGNRPALSATGGDTNVGFGFNTKGTGSFVFGTTTANADTINILPAAGGAGTFAGTLTSADLTAARTWTFPNVDGTVVTTGDTGSVTGTMIANDTVVLTTDTAGNYVASLANGNGITGGAAGSEGATLTLGIDLLDSADGTSAVTSAFSGLEFQGASSNELTLLQGCSDNQVLAWDESNSWWECSDKTGGTSNFTDSGTVTYLTDTTDNFALGGSTSTNARFYFDVTAGNRIAFEGTGADDANETELIITNPTADRTITFADASGTVILSGHTFTGDVTATLDTDGSTALTIGANTVDLGTETVGNYVATVSTSVLTGLTGGAAGSEGTNITLALDYSQALSGNVGLAADAGVFGTSGFAFEGSTADTIETFLVITDPTTSDKTITFPDASGTVLLSGGILLTLAGTSGSNQTISQGDTITIAAGTGITTTGGSTDTVTIAATLGTDIVGSEIVDNTIEEVDLEVTNSPTGGYVLTYDSGTGGFTWVDGGGLGNSKWTDSGTFTYLSNTGDDIGFGGSTVTSARYVFDVSTTGNTIYFEGTGADDANETAFVITNPTADRTFTFPNLTGTVATIDGNQTFTSATWNGTIVSAQYGGTGLNGSAAANGTLLIGNGSGYTLATLTEGEGIDITNASGSITILGEDATIANKGIASFNDSYFSVSSGAVSIDDIYLLNSGDTGTGQYIFSYVAGADSAATTNAIELAATTPVDTTGTNVHQFLNIDAEIGNATGGTNTANLISIDALTGDAEVSLNALLIGNLTGTAASEYALNIGSGWDAVLRVNGTDVINGSGQIITTQLTGTLISTAADSGSSTLIQGDTLTISGGTGISTSLSGDTYTITNSGDTTADTIADDGTITLTSEVTGILPIANGGTNKALTLAAGGVVWTDADSFEVSAAGTSGQTLISGGTGAPTWFAPTTGSLLFAGTSGILQQDNASLFFDDTNNRLGIGDTTPDALLDIAFSQTSGTLLEVTTGNPVTLAGTLTGQSIDLSTGVSATGFSVIGSSIALPTVTNTGSGTYNYQGLTVTGGAITQTTAAGTDTFNGVAVTNSNLTQTTGTLTANGLSVTTGSITTGGTQRGLQVTATGVGAGTLNGVNISNITGGAGTENAIVVGTGWDAGLVVAGVTVVNGSGGIVGSAITADSLDFTEFQDTLDLDANLTLNQTTNTWAQTFTGTTTTGYTYTANSLTSGKALSVESSATAMTGALQNITLTGSNAANTGNLLLIADTGASNATTPLKVTAAGGSSQTVALFENTGTGTSFRVNDSSSDSTPFLIDASGNVGIGTTTPAVMLDIYGTSNALRLSYDGSNYGTLSTASDGTLSFASSNTSESQFTIGIGASVDDSVAFDGASVDYFAGLDHTTGNFLIGSGFVVQTGSAFLNMTSTGLVGINMTPTARFDITHSSTSTTGATEYSLRNTFSDTGIVTTGTDTTYGNYTSLTRTGATGGTITSYGDYVTLTGDNAGSGSSNAYGQALVVTSADSNVGLSVSATSTATAATSTVTGSTGEAAGIFTLSDTGVVTTGTDTTYGLNTSVTRTGATGGTLNTYGNYTTLTNTFASGSGTITGYGDYVTATGNTNGTSTLYGNYVTATGADTTYGYNAAVTATTSATSYGLSSTVTDATTGVNTNRAASFTLTDTGVVTTGTSDLNYGTDIAVTRTGATGGTIASYGLNVVVNTDNAGSGTATAYGINLDTGVSGSTNADTVYGIKVATEANTSTTAYGLYVDAGTAAGTEYAAAFLNGAVGIGTSTPTSTFELYGAGTADIVSTITAPDATYDPTLKFRTGSTPAIQFTLGVDNSDSDKFKIYSGDGLGSGDEFVIDSNGVTTIANLNLGATNFDSDAGIASWVDMPVTSSSPVDTVESYTAQMDGNNMLTVYAESDGAGSIQNKAINFFDGAAGSASVKFLSTNFGTLMDAGGFMGNNSYFAEEFNTDTTAGVTADDATVVGDSGNWYFDTTDTAASYTQADQINGYGQVAVTTTATDIAGGIFFGTAQNNASLIFAKANLPVVQMKLRNTDGGTSGNDVVWGLMDSATVTATDDTLPANGIFFWSNNTTTWTGVVRSGGTNVGTATCGTQSTTQFAVGKIEVISATSVKFYMDTDVSNGISWTLCGTVSGANPTAAMTVGAYVVHTGTTATNVDVEYVRIWQDDSAPGGTVTYPKNLKSSLAPAPISPLDALTDTVEEQATTLETLSLQTNVNAGTLAELQASVDEQLTIIGTNLTALTAKDGEFDTRITELATNYQLLTTHYENLSTDVNTQATNITTLQADVMTLRDQVTTLTEFFTTFNLDNILTKDLEGNVDLLGGKLRARLVEAGGLVIENVVEDAPTIGQAKIYPLAVDTDNDGKDDVTGDDMSDEAVQARDGKTVIVMTRAMVPMIKGSRIFTSFLDNPNAFSWIEKIVTEEGEYVGFKIHLSETVTKVTKVDWWLIEQR